MIHSYLFYLIDLNSKDITLSFLLSLSISILPLLYLQSPPLSPSLLQSLPLIPSLPHPLNCTLTPTTPNPSDPKPCSHYFLPSWACFLVPLPHFPSSSSPYPLLLSAPLTQLIVHCCEQCLLRGSLGLLNHSMAEGPYSIVLVRSRDSEATEVFSKKLLLLNALCNEILLVKILFL